MYTEEHLVLSKIAGMAAMSAAAAGNVGAKAEHAGYVWRFSFKDKDPMILIYPAKLQGPRFHPHFGRGSVVRKRNVYHEWPSHLINDVFQALDKLTKELHRKVTEISERRRGR